LSVTAHEHANRRSGGGADTDTGDTRDISAAAAAAATAAATATANVTTSAIEAEVEVEAEGKAEAIYTYSETTTEAPERERVAVLDQAARQATQLAAQEEVIARAAAVAQAVVVGGEGALEGQRTPSRTTWPLSFGSTGPSSGCFGGGVDGGNGDGGAANTPGSTAAEPGETAMQPRVSPDATASTSMSIEASTPEPPRSMSRVVGAAVTPPMSATPPERNVRRLQLALCQRDRELRRVQQRWGRVAWYAAIQPRHWITSEPLYHLCSPSSQTLDSDISYLQLDSNSAGCWNVHSLAVTPAPLTTQFFMPRPPTQMR
jgi:hypothetical protein